MQHHSFPFTIENTKSVVNWAFEKPNVLIVFVHGFGGSAVKTWNEFPGTLNQHLEFRKCDFVFWEYDSLFAQANASAGLFMQFLDKMIEHPDWYQDGGDRVTFSRTTNFRYDRVIVVAHSLGSIVVRRALLNAYFTGKTWLERVETILFAPAHHGALVANLILESLTGNFRFASVAARFVSPVIDDLKPGSQVLIDIENETASLLEAGQGNFTISKCVIWAQKDRVVLMRRFGQDAIAEVVPGHSHTSVCKPKLLAGYTRPVEVLIRVLNS